ncbi:hypothetical protein DPQ33_09990 [Oceanidesulfovibrio indonesiensis]|uniref:Aminotransferase class I/classII large domain-containing protein n=2 Tax=Oceanidesulfovibrio indonesiensis TaxID=54767 RepID=A0A7M3ME70_9BACT|nr:hypothetical protein DPQ33_09990 [Oceanidesulfovibrio indonesiensis]
MRTRSAQETSMEAPYSNSPEDAKADATGAAAPHGGRLLAVARERGVRPQDVLDFSNNTDVLAEPVSERLLAGADTDYRHYPEAEAPLLTAALARHEGVESSHILPTHGAAEAILVTLAGLRPRRVLLVGPIFSEYERTARALSIPVEIHPLDPDEDFALSKTALEAIRNRMAETGADAVVLCSPNNPTGQVYERLPELAASLRHAILLVDQAYRDLAQDEEDRPAPVASYTELAAAAGEGVAVCCIGSLTKTCACPGLRLGYVVGDEDLVRTIAALKPPWSVTALAQHAGALFLEHAAEYADSRRRMPALRGELAAALAALPGVARVLPSKTNFLCVRLADGLRAGDVARALEEKLILVRDCDDITGMAPGFLRIQVRTERDNERLVDALGDVLRPRA